MNEWIIKLGLFIVFVNYTLMCSESGCFCYISGCFRFIKTCSIKDLVNEFIDDVLCVGRLNQHNYFSGILTRFSKIHWKHRHRKHSA